jgi:hypothetical protein
MKLRITKKDIRGARRNDWDRCPIARAANRRWPGRNVQVFDDAIWMGGNRFAHTDSTSEFTLAWNEGPVRPATLELPNGFKEALRR